MCPVGHVQLLQRFEPIIDLYVPEPQAVHAPPLGPVYPRLHLQLVCAVDPTTDCELAVQSAHAAGPVSVLYFPAPHSVHVPPSGPVYPRLQRHEPIAVSPEDVCPDLAGQDRQVIAAVAPTVAEYVLAAQSVHAASPGAVLYFPAPHSVHVPPSGPVYPRLQRHEPIAVSPEDVCPELAGQGRQVIAAVAPTVAEYVLAAQSVHAASPGAVLYFPATQPTHVPPLGPVYPRLQRQAETAVCPVADVTEFAGQVEHELSAAAPVDAEYLPAAQSVHVLATSAAEYLPAPQFVHVG
jgi:hypothetical protein